MNKKQENIIKEILQDFAGDCLSIYKYPDGSYQPEKLKKEIEETFIKINNKIGE